MEHLSAALSMAFAMGWEILWALVLGFTLSGVVQAAATKGEMVRLLPDSRPRTILVASALGAASSSCSYAAVALARSIFRKGGDFTAAMALQFASTNLVLELGITLAVLMGWQFTAAEFVGGPVMIALLVLLLRAALRATIGTMWRDFMPEAKRPKRMVLSREVMPRYSRMPPESANIFDNLHMLHGITYDCLAYPHWSIGQKRDELYRVIRAMSCQPGDERLACKFSLPHPDMDPRADYPWMHDGGGEMGRIMMEMMAEMMPLMMPGMDPAGHARMMAAMQAKMMPGMQPGEAEGSLHDAMMQAVLGIGLTPFSPLGRGFLAGTAKRAEDYPASD